MLESMGTLRDIHIQEICTIFDFIPEIKCRSPIASDKFLSIDEVSNDRLHSKFFNKLTLESFFSRFT